MMPLVHSEKVDCAGCMARHETRQQVSLALVEDLVVNDIECVPHLIFCHGSAFQLRSCRSTNACALIWGECRFRGKERGNLPGKRLVELEERAVAGVGIGQQHRIWKMRTQQIRV